MRHRLGSERRQLAGEPCVAEEIRAIGRDLKIEDGIGKHDFLEWLAHGERGIKDEQSAMVIADAQLTTTAHHAVGLNITEYAFLDLNATWQNSARQRERNLVASDEILGPTNDLSRSSGTVIYLTDTQAVCIRMWHKVDDLGYNDLVRINAALLDAFDFDASKGQQIAHLLDTRVRDIDVCFQPGEGDFHE